jgi:hypothetical protein
LVSEEDGWMEGRVCGVGERRGEEEEEEGRGRMLI